MSGVERPTTPRKWVIDPYAKFCIFGAYHDVVEEEVRAHAFFGQVAQNAARPWQFYPTPPITVFPFSGLTPTIRISKAEIEVSGYYGTSFARLLSIVAYNGGTSYTIGFVRAAYEYVPGDNYDPQQHAVITMADVAVGPPTPFGISQTGQYVLVAEPHADRIVVRKLQLIFDSGLSITSINNIGTTQWAHSVDSQETHVRQNYFERLDGVMIDSTNEKLTLFEVDIDSSGNVVGGQLDDVEMPGASTVASVIYGYNQDDGTIVFSQDGRTFVALARGTQLVGAVDVNQLYDPANNRYMAYSVNPGWLPLVGAGSQTLAHRVYEDKTTAAFFGMLLAYFEPTSITPPGV